jgi:ABC-2 type transport system permease protein
MRRPHNLGTVIRFEVVRALKKKSFWIMAFGFPLMFGLIFGIIFLSNKTTNNAAEDLSKQHFSIQYTDDSHLLNPTLVAAMKATPAASKEAAIKAVEQGSLDAYYYYPADVSKAPIEVYGRDVSLFENGRYEGVATNLLSMSVETSVSPEIKTIVQGKTEVKTTVYRDGKPYDAFKQMIFPAVFLVLFYFLISFFGNQMLTSTTEEKENRVIEMILTTIEARTLIIGKIISLVLLSMIQGLLVILPALIGYILFHDSLKLPALDLSSIPFDPFRVGMGAVIFIASFMLFTGLMVAIGAAVPTAKEAGGFIGLIMMLIFGPLYAASLFVSSPDSPLVRGLSLFPFTAPIPLMLRNALGNLAPWEYAVGIALLIIFGIITMLIAVRIFRFGALEYSRKLSVKEIFGRK